MEQLDLSFQIHEFVKRLTNNSYLPPQSINSGKCKQPTPGLQVIESISYDNNYYTKVSPYGVVINGQDSDIVVSLFEH